MDHTTRPIRLEESSQRFRTLDDLVLQLKGLVLVRSHRESDGARSDELAMYDREIETVREQLAAVTRTQAAA